MAMLDTTNLVATREKADYYCKASDHRPVVTDLAVALTDDLGALGDGERKPQLEGSQVLPSGVGLSSGPG